jgi:hypothetical protein
LRVLTFNSHQPYLHLLATVLPWTFGVVIPRTPQGAARPWKPQIRPLPGNVTLYASVAAALNDHRWDWVLAHNVHDVMDAREAHLPGVFLVHGTLSGRIVQDRATIDRQQYLAGVRKLLEAARCRVVYISELKRDDWGLPGSVIRSTVNPEQYGGYHGTRAVVLQVCNHFRERGAMLGWDIHRAVCRGVPDLVVGENPRIPGSRIAGSWEDLKEEYRSCRVYLHTAVYPYEDGFNLAVLEAMATGMPVGMVHHPTSLVEPGVDGFSAGSVEELREQIVWLLERPEEAIRMGSAARRKLGRDLPISSFRRQWESVAAEL